MVMINFNLLNEGNLRVVFGDGIPNDGITPDKIREEVNERMVNWKAKGQDKITVKAPGKRPRRDLEKAVDPLPC